MSALPEQPFNEHEQRYYLAEILKTSYIPPSDLLRVIRERGIDPRWNAMALPNGRSIDACVANLNYLTGQIMASPSARAPSHGYHTAPPEPPKPRGKRPSVSHAQTPVSAPHSTARHPYLVHQEPLISAQQSGGDLPIQARPSIPDASMQPQFSHFAAVNDHPSTPRGYQISQPESRGTGSDKKGKKRGRPSKAEYEERAALAAARGEPYPPPKKLKTPKPTSRGVPDEGAQETAPRGKGPRRLDYSLPSDVALTQPPALGPPISSPGSGPPVPMRGSSLEKTAGMGTRMQIDSPERVPRMVVPETQAVPIRRNSPNPPGARGQAGQAPRLDEEGAGTGVPQNTAGQSEKGQLGTIQHEREPIVKQEPSTAPG